MANAPHFSNLITNPIGGPPVIPAELARETVLPALGLAEALKESVHDLTNQLFRGALPDISTFAALVERMTGEAPALEAPKQAGFDYAAFIIEVHRITAACLLPLGQFYISNLGFEGAEDTDLAFDLERGQASTRPSGQVLFLIPSVFRRSHNEGSEIRFGNLGFYDVAHGIKDNCDFYSQLPHAGPGFRWLADALIKASGMLDGSFTERITLHTATALRCNLIAAFDVEQAATSAVSPLRRDGPVQRAIRENYRSVEGSDFVREGVAYLARGLASDIYALRLLQAIDPQHSSALALENGLVTHAQLLGFTADPRGAGAPGLAAALIDQAVIKAYGAGFYQTVENAYQTSGGRYDEFSSRMLDLLTDIFTSSFSAELGE